ncbi:dihydrolipoamide acetyltransferase family protein [Antarcticirhabdus aurantiaca]|uniref:2-oxo acid dehydrogenase subunit E2 n=1 Tax=Antarcticirhabdus aurantiaca TaxID=2606717 RepID=A0ACD4NP37_9HYPH|nr:dihydrolipoamide acetyltransferase family protein [Antarcticirhabdus aurantiaca]WAJ28604.1 2-oxo acid dehydrogenase subunit E2 [Jeongeuplla avenae]
MSTRTIRLPDVGEGVAEAELVEWHVAVGDTVREDAVLAAVMTDKATVEIPSPVEGTVAWLGGSVGDMLAVGSPLIRLEVGGGAVATEPAEAAVSRETPAESGASDGHRPAGGAISPVDEDAKSRADGGPQPRTGDAAGQSSRGEVPPSDRPAPSPPPKEETGRPAIPAAGRSSATQPGRPRPAGERPLASPAVRRRATEAGVDLRRIAGSGPAGRITAEDLAAHLDRGEGGAPSSAARRGADTSVIEVKVVGLRRRIAEKMATARDRIAPITYVEEVDCEALEQLRATLNADKRGERPKLTLLPFLVRALVLAVKDSPAMNAHFDDEAGIIRQYGGVHVGVAAQTDAGLVVPVLRHAEARGLWDMAAEIARLAEAAKRGGATREELTGSTVTVTSLGALGGIATTPVINHPEVAILGVNRMEVRPVWDGARFVPRRRMNLSSSFDHRVVDGWDAAVFVQRIKGLVENPAMLFIEA